MSAHVLPPTDRDFEVYRLVHVEQRSTREAAELMRISQTRVCQVLEKVAGFLVQVAPAEKDQGLAAKQLHVAEWVAAERLGFFMREAMAAFRQSQELQTVDREVESELTLKTRVRTTRRSSGDTRYLLAAARLSMLASKLPAGGFPLAALEDLRTAGDGEETATAPPKEACSAPEPEQASPSDFNTIEPAVSSAPAENCEATSATADATQISRARPVQSPPVPSTPPLSPPVHSTPATREKARKEFLAAAG